MKKTFKTLIVLTALLSLAATGFAQNDETQVHSTPRWISDKGYWVIESNIKNAKNSVIHFYNNNNTNIYSEKVDGVEINLKKRKTLMRLKRALDDSLLAWEKSQSVKDSNQLVQNLFKRR
jgi:predicted CoA-binding protein